MNGIKVDRIRYAGSVPTTEVLSAVRMALDCIHTIHVATVVRPSRQDRLGQSSGRRGIGFSTYPEGHCNFYSEHRGRVTGSVPFSFEPCLLWSIISSRRTEIFTLCARLHNRDGDHHKGISGQKFRGFMNPCISCI